MNDAAEILAGLLRNFDRLEGGQDRHDSEPYEVIGVMPESFTHRRADAYVPLQRELDLTTRGNHFMPVYARLKKGVSLERATADMSALASNWPKSSATTTALTCAPTPKWWWARCARRSTCFSARCSSCC